MTTDEALATKLREKGVGHVADANPFILWGRSGVDQHLYTVAQQQYERGRPLTVGAMWLLSVPFSLKGMHMVASPCIYKCECPTL